ncbi:MAG: pilus assembly protein TadG-related protein [Telluria sp.]
MILFALCLLVIVGFCALALDLGRLYNRKAEMQNAADTVALAAASELNGTIAGINKAIQQAATRMNAPAPQGLRYQYNRLEMTWSDAAIEFSATPNGGWVSLAAAKAMPEDMLYVRVTTANLDPAYGEVNTLFIRVLDPSLATASTNATAVAGRSSLNVAPLAVCAMQPERGADRAGELVEYGFRRGVGYDLMNLSPDLATMPSPQNFLIHPFAPPGATVPALNSDLSTVKPFICTGTLPIARVTNAGLTDGSITVASPFPLGSLFNQLNSRFDTYTAPCTPNSAPPDFNVKSYAYNTAAGWMNAVPNGQAADSTNVGNKIWNVAGPVPAPAGTVARSYGPLWSFARAAKSAEFLAGTPEPTAGYATFNTANWATLYAPAPSVSAAPGYPAVPPYSLSAGTNYAAPPSGRKGVRNRRVLNVALLACPVVAGKANVLGVGKFFMTVPATATSLFGEFAGVVSPQAVGGQVELYP